ncbi:MAG: DUF2851 family protein [Parachlamydiales bacterium]|jgi:hypothetical protein
MLDLYPQLVQLPVKNASISAAESKGKYLTLTERHIQALWWEQIYFKELITYCGKKITVLSPGQWNASSGPDFLKAHLIIEGCEYRGDIEMHLTDSGWEAHTHHTNPHYNKTILHISFWNHPRITPLTTESGKTIPCVYLEDQLNIPHQKILQVIDIDLYPYKPLLGTGNCSSAVFNTLTQDEIKHFLTSASFWRIHQKGKQISSLAENPEQSLTAALARCLGFPHNSSIFLQLYLSLSQLQGTYTTEEYQAYALGACGYFEDSHQEKWLNSQKYRTLLHLWEQRPELGIPKLKLFPQRTRPLHNPIRRIAALSFLLTDTSLKTLPEMLCKEWKESHPLCTKPGDWKKLGEKLKNLLPSYHCEYWNTHYFFEINKEDNSKNDIIIKPLVLLGEQIKKEMMVNVLLPYIYYNNNYENSSNESYCHIYTNLLSEYTYKTTYLKNRFFGNTSNGNILKYTFASQGALQIHFDFCQFFETSCIGCPFIERFNQKRIINNSVANK